MTAAVWLLLSIFISIFIYFFLMPYINKITVYIKMYFLFGRLKKKYKGKDQEKQFKEMQDLTKQIIKKEKL